MKWAMHFIMKSKGSVIIDYLIMKGFSSWHESPASGTKGEVKNSTIFDLREVNQPCINQCYNSFSATKFSTKHTHTHTHAPSGFISTSCSLTGARRTERILWGKVDVDIPK